MAAAQGTASRIEGVGFEQLGADALAQHAVAYRGHLWPEDGADAQELPNPGDYHFRCARSQRRLFWVIAQSAYGGTRSRKPRISASSQGRSVCLFAARCASLIWRNVNVSLNV